MFVAAVVERRLATGAAQTAADVTGLRVTHWESAARVLARAIRRRLPGLLNGNPFGCQIAVDAVWCVDEMGREFFGIAVERGNLVG